MLVAKWDKINSVVLVDWKHFYLLHWLTVEQLTQPSNANAVIIILNYFHPGISTECFTDLGKLNLLMVD